jgi:DNA-binding NarL/FixJ family response regulator
MRRPELVVFVAGGDALLRERVATALATDSISLGTSPQVAGVAVLAFDLGASEQAAELRAAVRELLVSRFVILSPSSGPLGARRAIREGAAGIVLEDDIEPALAPAVRAVAAGLTAIPVALRSSAEKVPLSHRELEVLRLVAAGKTNYEIALVLCLAESTVKSHLSSLFRKVGADSRKEIARLALDPDEGFSHLISRNGLDAPRGFPLPSSQGRLARRPL